MLNIYTIIIVLKVDGVDHLQWRTVKESVQAGDGDKCQTDE